MTIRNKNLVNGAVINIADTILYTVPASLLRVILTQARVVNTGAGIAVLNLWILQPSDILGTPNKTIINKNIGVGDSITLTTIINEVIGKGGSIHATSDIASSLYFTTSGLEVTA